MGATPDAAAPQGGAGPGGASVHGGSGDGQSGDDTSGARAGETGARTRRHAVASWPIRVAARLASVLIIAAAAAWVYTSFGVRRLDSGIFLHPVAQRMMAGEPYDPAVISAMEADMAVLLKDPVCDYQALQDYAVVRAALAEVAFQGDDPDLADQRLTRAEEAARVSLACSPASATAWTILAWIEHLRHEDTPLLRTYLDKAYRSGPYEGWALIRRMEILLSLYPALSDVEKARLRQAVEWIITAQMTEFIGEQYLAAKPEPRRALREILADAPERVQKRAAEFIRNNGDDIDLPLVDPMGSRPWK